MATFGTQAGGRADVREFRKSTVKVKAKAKAKKVKVNYLKKMMFLELLETHESAIKFSTQFFPIHIITKLTLDRDLACESKLRPGILSAAPHINGLTLSL